MQPPAAQLDELVRRIVEAVHPLRIILFGSSARGEMTPEVLERHRSSIGMVYREIWREGRELYAA